MEAITKRITALPVDAETFADKKEIKIRRSLSVSCDNFKEKISELCAGLEAHFAKKNWVYLSRAGESEGVYYVNEIVGLLPDLAVHQCSYAHSYYPITNSDSKIVSPERLKFAGFQGVIPNETEVKKLFNDSINFFRESNGNIKVCNGSRPGVSFNSGGGYRYMWTSNGDNYRTNGYNSYEQDYFWVIPIFRFGEGISSTQKLLWLWLNYNLTPRLNEAGEKIFNTLKKLHANDCLKLSGDKISLDEKKISDAINSGATFDFIDANALKETTIQGREFEDAPLKKLLNCDFNRVGLDPYDEKILYDPNRGHWDLWDLPTDAANTLKLAKPIYARNPAADVNASGIVGIDFGTKSTVVVFENERGEIIPLQVGKGEYSKGIKAENYENPTIIEFRNIEKFLAAYAERDGRPKTSLEDLTVSHNAQKNLDATTDSDMYASFFDSIKQWCGNLQYTRKIRDREGVEKDLPAFLEITVGEFNPLEYYAYYLGSYINHMLQPNHIFMKYILSFPVMYERNIRERMLQSFRAGILKSLPTALLDNEEAMKNFQVVEGTSEPAAYAVTALEGYGFMRGEENDGVYYSVFDFGGGTTDFDFGVLKLAEGDDADFYDYVLTHFGAHGDRTLGGENLLRLMAFEIFKSNKEKLLKPEENSQAKIPFTWAAEKKDFADSVALVRESQEANLNMHNLMEKLRPIWEAPTSDAAKKILDAGKVELTVFYDTGKEDTGFNLAIGEQTIFDKVKTISEELDFPFKVHPEKFERVKRKAWEGDLDAIKQLGEWASIGSDDSINELMKLSDNDFEQAQEIFEINLPKFQAKMYEADRKRFMVEDPPLVDLKKILRDRICRGVDNFFISMRDAFDKVSGGEDNGVAVLTDIQEIKIFLAGNSTKSAFVKKIFEEYIDYENGRARELLGFGKGQDMPRFILYPPLGTDEADKIQAENGIAVDKNNFERPTGKTGVAFGLLLCRDGSGIRVVDITPEGKDKKQVPFQFYVGRARLGKFKVVIDKAAKLGTWQKFIGAKLGVFDLLYTTESVAATNNAPATIAKRLTINFDADENANVYVKAVGSNKIAYTISADVPAPNIEGKLLTLD